MFRWLALVVLLGCLSISTYYRHRARLESETIPRRKEGTLVLAIRSLAGLAVLMSILAHTVAPRWMAWATFPRPGWVPWVGAMLGLLTIPAAYWVFASLGRNVSETVLPKQQHELVTTGPYRWIRHPLYTTGLALLLAIGLMVASWLLLLVAFIALAFVKSLVVPLEERQLLAKFGNRYRAYMLQTGRFLPRLPGRG